MRETGVVQQCAGGDARSHSDDQSGAWFGGVDQKRLWVWFRFAHRISRWWLARGEARKKSERAYFARLRKACNADNAREAYPLLLDWLNRFRPGLPLSEFLSSTADAELRREIERLTDILYGHSNNAVWSGKQMLHSLERLRSVRQVRNSAPALPPLNPLRGAPH